MKTSRHSRASLKALISIQAASVAAVISATLLLASTDARAATFVAAADLIVAAQGVYGYPANETTGYTFTVGATPISVDALGLNSGGGGLFVPNYVHLWLTGTTVDLASAGIDNTFPLSGVQAGGSLQYYYAAITPITLAANSTYSIGVDFPFANQGGAFVGAPVTDPRISYGTAFHGPAGTYPTTNTGGLPTYFGPTFQVADVPEPIAGTLFTLGLTALILRRRGK